jgi:hypothetical protein
MLQDFKELYPDYDYKLLDNWPLYRQKLIELAKKRPDITLKEIFNYIDGK